MTDSNLNRLVGGTLADVKAKRSKVVIAERTIRNLHEDYNVIGHAKKWELVTSELIDCDLIVGCVDKFCIRRDLEAFCRRHMIPYLDVGMDVHKWPNGKYEIYGQVILSMPGEVCMKCMGFLTEEVLSKEAKNYGDAGGKPQVVWSNGLLCSAAVGVVVDLFTDWSKKLRSPVFLAFRGSELSLTPDKRLPYLQMSRCCHFPLNQIGDPIFTPL
ncbi:MAG: ThiF family adenylyltransferase [bacterium]|nr:ThiF family adenylyltransferase [bacterium]